jgi:hypothetical protein
VALGAARALEKDSVAATSHSNCGYINIDILLFYNGRRYRRSGGIGSAGRCTRASLVYGSTGLTESADWSSALSYW